MHAVGSVDAQFLSAQTVVYVLVNVGGTQHKRSRECRITMRSGWRSSGRRPSGAPAGFSHACCRVKIPTVPDGPAAAACAPLANPSEAAYEARIVVAHLVNVAATLARHASLQCRPRCSPHASARPKEPVTPSRVSLHPAWLADSYPMQLRRDIT